MTASSQPHCFFWRRFVAQFAPLLTFLVSNSGATFFSDRHLLKTSLLPSFYHESCLSFFSSLIIGHYSLPPFPSLPLSPFFYSHILCLSETLTKGPRLENGSRARSPCSVLVRVPGTVSIHIPFENTMQPTAGALQMTRERWAGERERERQNEREKCTMALLQTIAINGIIFFPQRLRWGNNELHVSSLTMSGLHKVHDRQK